MKKGVSILKPNKTISQIAKEKGVSLLYATTQLRKGMKVESEHSKFKYAQRTIALQHLDENIDYYKKLAKMEASFEKGGKVANITFMEWVIEYNVNNKDEILAFFSLPSKYINPSLVSENNNNVILDVFEKQKDNIDAKKHFQKILDKADELGVTIYLEPIPRVHKLKSREHKQKITKDYLIKYYNNFGFIKDNNGFMVRPPKMAKGGELNPDDPKLKNTMIHKSGSAGGVLVGKRHSEGGIKAINKSSNSPLEMEGGEVVITRNAVSDNQKREFEGQMMTNREILSKINEDGGGVAFADGGKVEKEADCGCDDDEDDDKMEDGGDLNWGEDLGGGFSIGNDVYIIDTKSLFNGKTGYISGTIGKDLLVTISQDGNERNIVVSKKGVEKLDAPEFNDGGDTNSKIYKGFEIGSDGTYKIPNIKNFGIKHHDLPPSEAFKKLYSHTFEDGGEIYKDGGLIQIIDKQVPSMGAFENAFNHLNFHSVKNAYKQHLKKMYNVTFTELPHRIQMALLLGNQKLVDKFINE